MCVQRETSSVCEEIRNQAALNDRLLTRARGEVQMAHDKLETAKRFVANLEYGNAKTFERVQEQHAKVRSVALCIDHAVTTTCRVDAHATMQCSLLFRPAWRASGPSFANALQNHNAPQHGQQCT